MTMTPPVFWKATARLLLHIVTALLLAIGLTSCPAAIAAEATSPADATQLSLVSKSSIDYADASNWAYWADVVNPAELPAQSGNGAASQTTTKPADLFIVCPTVSAGSEDGAADSASDGSAASASASLDGAAGSTSDEGAYLNGGLNMSLTNRADRESFVGALNMELGIYSDQCEVFAPYYQQATLAAYALEGAALEEATELAYQDVRAAFEHYLQENPDGPIVLAGFSQGSDMIIRLIKDYFGDEELRGRLVAAYAIGWRLTQQECDEYPWLQAAQGEGDTGVVIAFNSEAEGMTDSLMVPAGATTLAINPLSWTTTSEPASSELNLGACFTDYDGQVTEEIPQLCGAYIDPERGTLKITGDAVTPETYPAGLDIFEDGIYHLYDYQFFYRNLQENVGVRLEAYLAE